VWVACSMAYLIDIRDVEQATHTVAHDD